MQQVPFNLLIKERFISEIAMQFLVMNQEYKLRVLCAQIFELDVLGQIRGDFDLSLKKQGLAS
ncbi:MAG: hypothetical protein K0R55_3359 [Sporomusa sp.]|nr:hypothetical protein [Sporomusa sp.]